jgi:hypothetical protein
MEKKPPMFHYYFYTFDSFTSQDFPSDDDAIKHTTDKPEIIRVMRARDSVDIWTKPKPE